MADIVDKQTRSRMMSGIRSVNSRAELEVRKYLFRQGYRYRLHVAGIPGRPDVVLSALKSVVFVHGCFWHRHARCKYAYTPRSNVDFWTKKFAGNVKRDRRVRAQLRRAGWNVHVIWECQVNRRGLERLRSELGRSAAA
jgi:DNA mismatch endonuclease (patch repair protein)